MVNTTYSGTQTFAYTHDGNGNTRLPTPEAAGNGGQVLTENSISYGYDALNRLTSWVHDGVSTTYDYDDAGNLLEVANDTIPVRTFTMAHCVRVRRPTSNVRCPPEDRI